jgi:ubiquinone/menaquinone biosynthesis C-methylase UbiE
MARPLRRHGSFDSWRKEMSAVINPLNRTEGADSRHRRLVARYDMAASRWQRRIATLGYPAAYRLLARRALARLAPDPICPGSFRVLDAGAGTADFALALAKVLADAAQLNGASFVLADPSPVMLHLAQQRMIEAGMQAAGLCCALEHLPPVADPFDMVLCSHVIEHLPDPQGAMGHLFWQLRPGGLLVLAISKPHWCTALLCSIWGHKHFKEEEVLQMLGRCGFAEAVAIRFESGPPSRTSLGYLAKRPE